MVVLLAALLSAFIGAISAWAARAQDALREDLLSTFFLVGLCYQTGSVIPIAVFSLKFYPDWSASYLLEPAASPWLYGESLKLMLMAVGLGYLALVVGFYGTRALVVRGRVVLAAFAPLLLLLGGGGAGYAVHDRLLRVGTFDAWREGQAAPLLGSSVGVWGTAVTAVTLVYAIMVLRRFARPS